MKVHNSENAEYSPNQHNVQQNSEQKNFKTIFSDKNNNRKVDAFDFDYDEKIVKQLQDEGLLGKLWKDVNEKVNNLLEPNNDRKSIIKQVKENGIVVAQLHYWEGEQEPFMKETVENGKVIKREMSDPPITLKLFYDGEYLIREEEIWGDDIETFEQNGKNFSTNFGGHHIIREFDKSQKYTGKEPLIDREPINEISLDSNGNTISTTESDLKGNENTTYYSGSDVVVIKSNNNGYERSMNGILVEQAFTDENGNEHITEYGYDTGNGWYGTLLNGEHLLKHTQVWTKEGKLLNEIKEYENGIYEEFHYDINKDQIIEMRANKRDFRGGTYLKSIVKDRFGNIEKYDFINGQEIHTINGIPADTRDKNGNGERRFLYDFGIRVETYSGSKIVKTIDAEEVVYEDKRDFGDHK